MRVGVYTGNYLPEGGGGFTFEESIIHSILHNKSHHQFYIFYHGKDKIKDNNLSVKYISLYHDHNTMYSAKNIINKINKGISKIVGTIDTNENFLNKLISKNKIDLMWFITPRYEKINIPFFFTVWDLAHRRYPYFPEVSVTGFTWKQREAHYSEVLPQAAYILTGTNFGKEEIERYYHIPMERIFVLPLPTPSFINRYKTSRKEVLEKYRLPKKYLFYPAQFWPHKNHIGLLLSLKILKEKYNSTISIIFTGSDMGNKKYIQKKTRELGLINQVYFLDFVSREILVELYRNAFAMVYPSFFGPDNLPPLEAFALGCPVIAAKVPGVTEQLGDAALLINPVDEKEMAKAIKRLFTYPGLRKELVKKGRIQADQWNSDDYLQYVYKIIDSFDSYRRCWSSEDTYMHS
jgi:glycosyltransferase involved in cell wall biosynthesis